MPIIYVSDMKTFYIFDNFFLPTPYNHRFFVEKFASGFKSHGFEVKVVNHVDEIKEDGFVMISNHPFYYSLGNKGKHKSLVRNLFLGLEKFDPLKLLPAVARLFQRRTIGKLAAGIKGKDQVLIAWFWHNEEDFFNSLGVPVIFTGEYLYGMPEEDYHRNWHKFYHSRKNALPIKFSAKIDPSQVGEGCNNTAIAISYVGNRQYKPDWYRLFQTRHDCRIVPTLPYISEEERLNIYKNSQISLGLHSEDNIRSKVVVERIFEALAYGALCFTDNPNAVEATQGCAIFIKDKEQLLALVDEYLGGEGKRMALRQRGFEFIRNQGTNFHRAKEFIELKERI